MTQWVNALAGSVIQSPSKRICIQTTTRKFVLVIWLIFSIRKHDAMCHTDITQSCDEPAKYNKKQQKTLVLELIIVEQETYAVLQNKPINFKSEIVAVKKDTELAVVTFDVSINNRVFAIFQKGGLYDCASQLILRKITKGKSRLHPATQVKLQTNKDKTH